LWGALGVHSVHQKSSGNGPITSHFGREAVNKSQLIDALAARYEGNRKQAQHALDSVLDTITREVAKGEKVAITGFGAFEKRVREARWVRNPQTGARIKAKKTAVPKFTAGADLKNVVSGAKKLPKLTLTTGTGTGSGAGGRTTTAAKTTSGARKTASATKASPAAKKSTAKKSTAKKSTAKTTAKKTTAKKSTAKKTTAKKTPAAAKKTTAKKVVATKSAARKAPAKKSTAKKAPAKKTTARKSTAKRTAKKS
jgi:DNA-binding protein HU-beta